MTESEDLDFIFLIKVSSYREVHTGLPDDGGYAQWFATLLGYVETPDDAVELGTATMVLFRNARWNPNFWDRMDEENADMEILASAVSGGSAADEELFERFDSDGGDILFFDRVSIASEYRGHDYSHVLVNAAAQALVPESVIALQPMPQGRQLPEDIERLQNHWVKMGFEPYRAGVYVRAAVQ